MLSIVFKDGSSQEFWIPFNKSSVMCVNTSDVEAIHANGDELEHIKLSFSDTVPGKYGDIVRLYYIPFNKGSIRHTWFGDIAKTIVANL